MSRTNSIHIFKPFIVQQLQMMLAERLLYINLNMSPVLGQGACLLLDMIQLKTSIAVELYTN